MTETTYLTAEQVLTFLKENPDFLSKNEDILAHITPPSVHKSGSVVDFQHFMLNRLKSDKERAIKDRKALIEISRSNMSTLNRIHTAALRILDVRSLEEYLETVITELPLILDVDMVAIILEKGDYELPHHYSNGIRMAEKGVITALLEGQNFKLQANITNPEYVSSLYGKGAAHLVKSHALVQLQDISKHTPCLVAFASRNPTVFDDTQGTELIRFLTQVIEKTLKYWLAA